jgi:hypothetical protein
MTNATPNAFLIDATTAGPIAHPLTLDALQATVGGYIEAAFTVPSPARNGYAITGYVNDEGLLVELPVSAITSTNGPLAGPLIVCGLNLSDGETAALTAEELEYLTERTRLLGAAGTLGGAMQAVHALDLR